jgi:hypothetical protein
VMKTYSDSGVPESITDDNPTKTLDGIWNYRPHHRITKAVQRSTVFTMNAVLFV